MATTEQKTALELEKAKALWKELVNNRQPDVKKIFALFTRYKAFLEENEILFDGHKAEKLKKEVEALEALLHRQQEVSSRREKGFLLNDAYIGLMFTVSESIDELTNREESLSLLLNK